MPLEQIYERINGIWNLSSDQGNLGSLIITNVRIVWFAALAENFNVSIPYLRVRDVITRNSKFGECLVVHTTEASGGYTLGFRVDGNNNLEQLHLQVRNLWQVAESGFFNILSDSVFDSVII